MAGFRSTQGCAMGLSGLHRPWPPAPEWQRWAEQTQDPRRVLGAAGGAPMKGPCSLPEHGSVQPCQAQQLQEGLVQCRWYMGRRWVTPDHGGCHPRGSWDGSVSWVGIKWDSREQTSSLDTVDWEFWFNEHLLVSGQNILVWDFTSLHTLKNRGIWTFRWLDLLYKTVGKWTCQTPVGFDFYFKMSVKSPPLYKKEDRFYYL